MKKRRDPLPMIGWREWVSLPELGIDTLKLKVDTGARTSALHAVKIKPFEKDGKPWVRFVVHPEQRSSRTSVPCELPVLDERGIKNSGGKIEHRYTVLTDVVLGEHRWSIELTLTNRENMGIRMLLGREAMRNRFVVDPARSFLQSPDLS